MMISKLVLLVLMWRADNAFGVPSEVLSMHEATKKFQNSLQQQSFQSVLISIEDRLRNLDNIYSMQLSETLKVKLDQYHRKLETLDTKIIRLESLVMLNLDKISENFSTKNYKDDLSRTQLSRRLENVYEGLGHKINYMERKFEVSIDKLQNKADSTLQRLERMEDDMMQRHGDIEAELSENFSSLEEYKSSTTSIAENTLTGIANTLKVIITQNINNTIQDLNRTIQERLNLVNRGILEVFNETHHMKEKSDSLKRELKQDLNSYANKVSDLNMDLWKRTSGVEDKIKNIEVVTNASRIESQNGVRALMLQIGKTSSKGSSSDLSNNDNTSMESLKKAFNLSLEKIISNQELFLESCHRVQMDESQIESEISTLLGKLIDMLDVKLATAIKDLKTVEKSLKNHDSRVNRNLNQANTNIKSLSKQSRDSETVLEDIKLSVNSLFTFVQDVLPPGGEPHVTEKMLSDVLHNMTLLNLQNAENASTEVRNSLFSKQDFSEVLKIILNEKFVNFINETQHTLEQGNNAVLKTLKMNCSNNRETKTNLLGTNNTSSTLNQINQSDMGSQNYRDLIDVCAGFPCNNKTVHRTYSEEIEMEANLNRTILAIFGKPPITNEVSKKGKLCPSTWESIIDVKYTGSNCTKKKIVEKIKSKHRHNNYKSKINVRFEANSDSTTDIYGVEIDEMETTTEVDSMTIIPTLIAEIESSTNKGGED